jgi:membrane protease subunit (stomatin/prohibitin family)
MGLWTKLKGELIDIVEWLDPTNNTLVHRFQRYNNEIKYGAKLVVRPSQVGVFVNMGKIADVFENGMYTLDTKNLPILSTLLGWKYGFNSPFKCEVYFVCVRKYTDNKWGTKNPIMLRDPEFGPVRLRAFGTYAFQVSDPAKLITAIAGTDARFTTDEISDQLRNLIVARFADLLGESKLPILDLAANYNELGGKISETISAEFKEQYGIDVHTLVIENISLPPEVEKALDKRASMGILGNMQQYTQFQAANALTDAAKNPGTAGDSMGLGMGLLMAGQLGQVMPRQAAAPASGGPPPLPSAPKFYVALAGQQAGPFEVQVIQQQVVNKQVTPDTLVWRTGMAEWKKASEVPELAPLFDSVPPPLPK